MPFRAQVSEALARWRDVERRIAAAPPESPDLEGLMEEAARLRLEHARLTALAAAQGSKVDPKRELAGRSSEMLDELAHLKETEKLKRQEPISTPSFHALADEVSASSRRIFALGAQQEKLGDEAETGEETIEDVERTG